MTNKNVEYIDGMIYLNPKYYMPIDSKEALEHMEEIYKPAIERTIEAMKDSEFYFKMEDLKGLDELAELLKIEIKGDK